MFQSSFKRMHANVRAWISMRGLPNYLASIWGAQEGPVLMGYIYFLIKVFMFAFHKRKKLKG